jgi:type I restriction enzyme M protein
MSALQGLMSRADVARAAGVLPQAVNNWERRHPDFPRAVQHGSQRYFAVDAVAEWLDGRLIPGNDLRSHERKGLTFGARFRVAAGLPLPPPADVPQADPLDQQLWAPLEQLLGRSDEPAVFEAVVLSLLCLGVTDSDGWSEIRRATEMTIRDIVVQRWRLQSGPLADATAALGDIPDTAWWRRQLVDLVPILHRTRNAQAFEYLLDRFARHRRSTSGEYLIPAELAQLLVRMVDPRPGDHVHDPCCGSGALLVAASEHMLATAATNLPATVTGRAATTRGWSLATMNIAMHDLTVDLGGHPSSDPGLVDAGLGRFDVVLLNPPFGRKSWSLPASTPKQRPWSYGEPSPYNVSFAWLQVAIEALVPGGRAAVVMPYSATQGTTPRERRIRETMIEHGAVRCVVTLPGHLFRETTVEVTVWIVTRPLEDGGASDAGRDVLLIDGRAATRKDSPTHRILTEYGRRAIVALYQEWLTGSASFPIPVDEVTATTATVADLRAHGYDLQPATYLRPRRHGVAQQQTQERLRSLPHELARLDAVARAADLALNRRLKELTLWTR